ncbi:MAG TPA: amidohydrolase family protein [Pyrinomonadaceae bacterium]|nr:amidohydrolase family protein [Pyrinomonadaceae bacterium]
MIRPTSDNSRRYFRLCVLFMLLMSSATTITAQIAVRGETVHTMAGQSIRDGVVLIRDGKIERVGAAGEVKIPAGYKTVSAKVVTPGLIDAHTVVGLSGYLNQPHDQMQLERSAPIQPELRAIDAYDAREKLVEYVRGFGVTTIHTGHGPGALISGQTMIVKTVGDNVDEAVINPTAMVSATLGEDGLGQGGKPPGTRAKTIAMLRAELIKAREYDAKTTTAKEDQRPARDLRMETMVRLIKRELPLLVNVHRAQDIISALRLAKEFNIRIVLDGASEGYLVAEQIKAAGVPVIVHPTMYRAVGEAENLSMETAATLRKAGVSIALQSGFEGYVPKTRIVLFEAAAAAANGLSFNDALAAVTIDAARILGVAARVGSLETGKDADLALFDGDPFEYTSHVTGVIVSGKMVSETAR